MQLAAGMPYCDGVANETRVNARISLPTRGCGRRQEHSVPTRTGLAGNHQYLGRLTASLVQVRSPRMKTSRRASAPANISRVRLLKDVAAQTCAWRHEPRHPAWPPYAAWHSPYKYACHQHTTSQNWWNACVQPALLVTRTSCGGRRTLGAKPPLLTRCCARRAEQQRKSAIDATRDAAATHEKPAPHLGSARALARRAPAYHV